MGTRAHVMVAAALLMPVLALGGCAAPAMPPALSDEQVAAIIAERNAEWWNAMFPGEEMPTYAVVRLVPQDEPNPYIEVCLHDVNVVLEASDDGTSFFAHSTEELELYQRELFRCALQYPVEYTDPTAAGLLSEQQLAWVYDYFEYRLIPCLRLAGYVVGDLPSRETFVAAPWGTWSPYDMMSNPPTSEDGWARLDQRCPPPAIGPLFRSFETAGEP